jgi:hypothetical protein
MIRVCEGQFIYPAKFIIMKKQFPSKLLLFLILSIVFVSCKKDANTPPAAPSIYVGGESSIEGISIAVVWKDGLATNLTDGTKDAYVNSVYVSGGEVYLLGQEYNGVKYLAKVRKNGSVSDLTDGSQMANASSIFVSLGE